MLNCVKSDSNFLNTVFTANESGFTGPTLNKGAALTMETSVIPEAKESTAGPQQRRFVYRISTPLGCCITNTHHKAKP
jgi:hypothetical protein